MNAYVWLTFFALRYSIIMSENDREQKNAVFSTGQAEPVVQQRIQTMVDVPTEVCPLPSSGVVYPQTSSLHGCETVEIRHLSTKEEDILTNKIFLKKGTVISELIKSCLIDKTIDPTTMLAGDRNALMVAIRVTGYGEHYDADVTCGNDECGVKTSRTFNLSELDINRLTLTPTVPGTNQFEFRLPSGKLVKFRFLTGADEEEQTVIAERQRKAGLVGLQESSNVSSTLLKSIISVDGVDDRQQIAKFVSIMSGKDSHALRKYIRQNEPGIRMKQETECPVCSHVEEVSIPIGITFLYPGLES